MRSLWWKYGSRLGAIAIVGLSAVIVQAADDAKEKPTDEPQLNIDFDQDVTGDVASEHLRPVRPPARDRTFLWNDIGPHRVKLSEYWLGIHCMPAHPAMRSQLKLAADEGILVAEVMADSPAAKAGIKEHDLLLSAGDKPLKDVKQFMTLLDENKDQELPFTVLRAGEKMTVAVKPEKRPQPEGPLRDQVRANIDFLREKMEESGDPVRFKFFHPGIVLPAEAPVTAFPDDLHVHIHKHGGKPAEIVVERGDKKWNVTEDKLDGLPDDVRPHVESLLGRIPLPKFDFKIERAPEGATFNIPLPPPGEFGERMERRLEEMSNRMEQMRKQINEIRDQRRQNREEKRDGREERHDHAEEHPHESEHEDKN
jgi:hypothetical protein